MNDYTNIKKALEIARMLKIEIPQKYAVRVIKNKELQKKLINTLETQVLLVIMIMGGQSVGVMLVWMKLEHHFV